MSGRRFTVRLRRARIRDGIATPIGTSTFEVFVPNRERAKRSVPRATQPRALAPRKAS